MDGGLVSLFGVLDGAFDEVVAAGEDAGGEELGQCAEVGEGDVIHFLGIAAGLEGGDADPGKRFISPPRR